MHLSAIKSLSAHRPPGRLLICAMLPIWHAGAAAYGAPKMIAPLPTPYLLVCLPPPLRFAEPLCPSAHPPAPPRPPEPMGQPEDILAAITTINQEAALASTPPSPFEPTDPALPTATPVIVPASTPIPPAPGGISILPDDTPRAIRSEDVLLYFQFPSNPPSPGAPPPSSATYQQK